MANSKIEYFGKVLMDLTQDTVTPETLAEGATAHNAKGEIITGTLNTNVDLTGTVWRLNDTIDVSIEKEWTLTFNSIDNDFVEIRIFNDAIYYYYDNGEFVEVGPQAYNSTDGWNTNFGDVQTINILSQVPLDFCNWLIKNAKQVVENSSNEELIGLIDGTLTDLQIPNGTTTIRRYAFAYASIKSVVIPQTVTTVGAMSFYYCQSLETLDVPSGITDIPGNFASNCTALTKVILRGDLTSVGTQAFNNNPNVLEYDFTNCTTVPTLGSTNPFGNINANCIIKVPASLLSAWKAKVYWRNYADYIVGV